jgi:hypothetical protein
MDLHVRFDIAQWILCLRACTCGVSFILYCTCSVGLAYEMMHPAESPWKPLICNFSPTYDKFLQMQSSEELERATAEIIIANPQWNASKVIEKTESARQR